MQHASFVLCLLRFRLVSSRVSLVCCLLPYVFASPFHCVFFTHPLAELLGVWG